MLLRERSLLFILFLLTVSSTFAQPGLFMPIEFKRAYENGTRNWDGSVSDRYFQNRAKYDIRASVDPATRQIEAEGSITYFNNQPIDLNWVLFHAYKDHYEEGMVIKEIKVNGNPIKLEDDDQIRKSETYYRIHLKKPISQGDSVKMNIQWSITIPPDVNRDGAYDETSMMVAYWYPEIMVFDDLFGWDDIDFDGKAEFYHDFSDFDVQIEIPKNFVIWASDAPTNSEKIFPKKLLERIQDAQQSSDKIEIITKKDLKKGLEMESNLWKYSVDSFPDFCFAFSDHYLWEACTYEDKNGRYFLNAAYPIKNESFKDVLGIEKEALKSFHTEFPVYPFPFKHFVAFNGEKGGGMEFPGMCNDEARFDYRAEGIPYSDYEANKLLTYHEMMHMYFPFLMGINEKRFAWIDEGMAEFSEDYYTDVNLESYRSRHRFAKSENPPLMVQTYTIPKTYGVISYDLASQSYHALLHLLGEQLFTECMQTFMDRWKYKHPSPYDFFFTVNDVSGQDLNWFWKAWYFDFGYPDVGIKSFENGKLTIENLGGLPIAVEMVVQYDDNSVGTEMLSPIVWKQNTQFTKTLKKAGIKSIELKTLNGPDAILNNNKWTKR